MILVCLLLNLIANAQKLSNKPINFARIIRYSVFVRDTTTLKNELSKTDSDYQISEVNFNRQDLYIDQLSFNQFINVILKYLNDKKSKAYAWGKEINKEVLKKQVYKNYTSEVKKIDANGNVYDTIFNTHDSSYLFSDVKSIEFIESWWIDPKTYQIRKEVLSYSLIYFDYINYFYRSAITIYRDEDAVIKINELVK